MIDGLIKFGLLCIAVVLPLALWCALVLMLLWNWYIPSIFPIGEIGYAQSFGLALIASMLGSSDSADKSFEDLYIMAFVSGITIMFLGWVGSLFI